MLTKAICVKCPHSYLGTVKYAGKGNKHQTNVRMQSFFDADWKAGIVHCNISDITLTNEPPPDDCPYALEHILNMPNALAEAMMTRR